jgi:hypothetical protein
MFFAAFKSRVFAVAAPHAGEGCLRRAVLAATWSLLCGFLWRCADRHQLELIRALARLAPISGLNAGACGAEIQVTAMVSPIVRLMSKLASILLIASP